MILQLTCDFEDLFPTSSISQTDTWIIEEEVVLEWGIEHQLAFEELKENLIDLPILNVFLVLFRDKEIAIRQ